jgi:hypothetical protein
MLNIPERADYLLFSGTFILANKLQVVDDKMVEGLSTNVRWLGAKRVGREWETDLREQYELTFTPKPETRYHDPDDSNDDGASNYVQKAYKHAVCRLCRISNCLHWTVIFF